MQLSADPLERLQFSIKTEHNRDFINGKLLSFESRKDIRCEWIQSMVEDESGTYSYLYDEGNLYAAISNDTPKKVNGIMFYYSNNSCTFDRLTIPGHPELSSGRVLRAFRLYTIYLMLGGPFVYCGLVIPTALEYNKTMGLIPFNQTRFPPSPQLLTYFREELGDETFTLDRLTFDPEHSNLLFFLMNPAKLGGNPVSPYTIIQYLLPKSKKIAGSKRKSKKRKSRKY